MSKVIRVSDDSGSNYYSLPGPDGSFQANGDQLDDSILGQTFASGLTGLIDWSIVGSAYYKGFAGYNAVMKKSGTATATTGEAMSVVTGKTYRIDDSAKEVWSTTATLTVYDDGSPVSTANIESIDYLFGMVTFDSGYTIVGSITVDATYYPMSTFGCARDFTLTQSVNAFDTSCYPVVQSNGGYRTHEAGLRTVNLELNGIFQASDAWQTALAAREAIVIEVNADGNGKSTARGWFRQTSSNQEGQVGDNEMESVSFVLSVSDPDIVPFSWDHASDTTLSYAVQVVLNSFESQVDILAQYLYDGTNGYGGTVVVSECSLASSIDDMNSFSVTLMGDGAFTAVP